MASKQQNGTPPGTLHAQGRAGSWAPAALTWLFSRDTCQTHGEHLERTYTRPTCSPSDSGGPRWRLYF